MWDAIFHRGESLDDALFIDIRLPRALAGVIAGAALAARRGRAAGDHAQPAGRARDARPDRGRRAGRDAGRRLRARWRRARRRSRWRSSASRVGTLLIGAMAAAGGGGIRLILAGMAVGLALAAASGAVRLARETETSGLFLWGAGSLLQTGWGPVAGGGADRHRRGRSACSRSRARSTSPCWGRSTARGARAALRRSRRSRASTLAAVLTAVAVGLCGPIAFVGILAGGLARFARPRGHAGMLAVALPWGAAILLAADVAGPRDHRAGHRDARGRRLRADRRAGADRRRAAAARRGRRRRSTAPRAPRAGARGRRSSPPRCCRSRSSAASAWARSGSARARSCARSSAPARRWGRSRSTRARRGCASRCSAAPAWRRPGTVLQAAVRNPFAGPELAGVVGGASVGAFAVLLAFPDAPSLVLPFAAFAGALVAMAIVLALAGGGSPARLALDRARGHRGLRRGDDADAAARPARRGDRDHVAVGLDLRDQLERPAAARGPGGRAAAGRAARGPAARRADARRRARRGRSACAWASPAPGCSPSGAALGRRRGRRLRRDRVRRPARAARRAAARGRQPPPRAADGDGARRAAARRWPIPSGAPCSPRPRSRPASSSR